MSEVPNGWAAERLDIVSELNPSKVAVEMPDAAPVVFVGMASVYEEFGGIDVSATRAATVAKRRKRSKE